MHLYHVWVAGHGAGALDRGLAGYLRVRARRKVVVATEHGMPALHICGRVEDNGTAGARGEVIREGARIETILSGLLAEHFRNARSSLRHLRPKGVQPGELLHRIG